MRGGSSHDGLAQSRGRPSALCWSACSASSRSGVASLSGSSRRPARRERERALMQQPRNGVARGQCRLGRLYGSLSSTARKAASRRRRSLPLSSSTIRTHLRRPRWQLVATSAGRRQSRHFCCARVRASAQRESEPSVYEVGCAVAHAFACAVKPERKVTCCTRKPRDRASITFAEPWRLQYSSGCAPQRAV